MHAHEPHELTLPPQAVANPEFPYERQVANARRYLAARGITEVRPVYGAKPSWPAAPQGAVRASERALSRWFEARCA